MSKKMKQDYLLYEREPIKLSSHAVLLLHLFTRTDHLEDLCWLDGDATKNHPKHPYRSAAKQFMLQLEGHHCIAFLLALRDELNIEIKEWQATVRQLRRQQSRRAGGEG